MTEPKPPITGTMHTLPFDKLSPRDFERLCLWLVRREGYERAEHLGAAGSEQGRDIVAWREGKRWAFQCKRVRRFGPKDALTEVEKVLALPEVERPAGLVFLVTCDVSDKARQQVRNRCIKEEMECHFWTGTELDERVKRHTDIVEEFISYPPRSLWEDFLHLPPVVFYSMLIIAILVVIVVLTSGLISIGADIGGARQQLQEWGWIHAFPSEGEDEILIVIASFHHSEGVPDTEIHNEIRLAIREAAEEVGFSNLRVEVEPTRLAADDQARAEKLGQRYNASIVIWGADTGVRVAVSYLNLKQPDLDAAEVKISETERTQLINPSAYASLVTQDLPGQLAFLSLFAIGQSYYIEGNYEGAIAVIEAAINSLASDGNLPEGVAEAHFRLGWLYQDKLRKTEQAIAAYSKAIELDPTMVAAYSNRAFAHFFLSFSDFDQNDVNAAFVDFEKVIELAPDSARAYENRGMMRIARIVAQSYPSTAILSPDVLDAAFADFRKAIELDPDYVSPYINRGNIYRLLGDSDAALADFNRAIKLDPDNAALYHDRGLVHLEQDDLDAAIVDFDTSIELESQLTMSPDNQDDEQRTLRDPDEVTYKFDIELAFSGPTLAETYYRRGTVLAMQGRLNEAMADYNKAIELDPNFAEVYSNRGTVRYQQGKLVSALADFDKAIELGPDYAEAYWRRGLVLRRFSDLNAALADFRTFLELRPDADNRAQIEEWIAELEAEIPNK